MAASTDYKRLFIRLAFTGALSASLSFQNFLLAQASAAFTQTSTGKYVSVTQAANRRVEFEIPPPGRGVTTYEIAELVSQLLDLYDQSKAALISAGISAPTDQQIYDEMLDRSQPRKVVRADFSGDYWNNSANGVGIGAAGGYPG